ncbi:MAG TPA: RagB/SusD family nutrient uptake outer membrane protein [Prolixibacteraceae bacterium]|nr:RagB/SusD family nutrient uptake outer membrane protein [Prolixibacteraceae bacterium]
MKQVKYIILIFVVSITLWSCEQTFLDVKNVEAGVTVDDMYTRYNQIQGVVWATYSFLPDGLNEVWREAATDVAEATSEGSQAQFFNKGNWNSIINPDDVWSHNFQGINQANSYLANKGQVDLEYIKTGSTETDSTNYFKALNNVKFMEGEILFLKAFFYFELVKRYGGVPIIETALEYEETSSWENLQRNSLNECVEYIVQLCDNAAKIIPSDLSKYSWYEDGRVTYGAIKALKAKTLLYAASPSYKTAGSQYNWEQAAAAAHDVIQLGTYSLNSTYEGLFGSSNAKSKEFIFTRRYGSMNWVEYNQYPISFVGSNGNSFTPTQNFVDQYEVINNDGSSSNFSWDNATHTANPYANRDPRLAATVITNGTKFKTTTIETFIGGNNGLPKQNATKTGYYLRKWVNTAIDLVNGTSADHTWCYFRYADVLLSYAEAMLNAYGPNADPNAYGLTALDAVNMVRARVSLPQLSESQLNQEQIERERMLELAFEDQRYWDVQRWNKGTEYFNKTVKRVIITKTDSDLSYAINDLENRKFAEHMNWYPIPKGEITKTGWEQNPGWE